MPTREQKRDSAKKNRDYSIYSKKAVRAKEALIQKTCPVPPKGPGATSH